MTLKSRSILLGIITILCWGSLATFGNLLLHLPPFYVLGITFILGSIPAWFKPREFFPVKKTLLLGVAGYFGYHFFLFYSFRFAPAIEANLINYLWPVFMVILTPVFFPSQSLKSFHILGAILSVIGSCFLVFENGGEFKSENLFGYLLALAAALTWPLYSLGKLKMPPTSVWSIGSFCLISGVLCLLTHFLIEPHVVLQMNDALKLLFMGLGPFGLAFYCWDYALKNGDAKIIGALAYLTPIISTLGLVVFAGQNLSFSGLMAMVFIFLGASTGLLDILKPKS